MTQFSMCSRLTHADMLCVYMHPPADIICGNRLETRPSYHVCGGLPNPTTKGRNHLQLSNKPWAPRVRSCNGCMRYGQILVCWDLHDSHLMGFFMCSCCCMFSLMHFCSDETGGSTQPPYKCMWGALHSLRHLHAITDDGFKLRFHAELHPQVQDGRHLVSTRHPCTGMWGSNPIASSFYAIVHTPFGGSPSVQHE